MVNFLLLVLSLVLRKDWLGITVGGLILTSVLVVPGLGTEHVPGLLLSTISVWILVFTAVRFGLLAIITALCVLHLWVFFPVTTDFSAWYATIFIGDLVLLAALVGYGYYLSLGGQPMFSGKLLLDE